MLRGTILSHNNDSTDHTNHTTLISSGSGSMKVDADNETHVGTVDEETDEKETVVMPTSVARREGQGCSGRFLLDSVTANEPCLACFRRSQVQSKHEAALDHVTADAPCLMPHCSSHVWTSLAYQWTE